MDETVTQAPAPPAPEPPAAQEPEQVATQPGTTDRWQKWCGAAAIIGIAGPCMWYAPNFPESAAFYAFLLLVLSPALLFAAVLTAEEAPQRKVIAIAIVLEVLKVLFLWMYSYADQHRMWAARISFVATAVAVAFLPLILVFVRSAILQKKTQESIRYNFFSVLCGVLFLFLHVLYSCTFALGLHDQVAAEEALRATQPCCVTRGLFQFSEGKSQIDDAIGLSKRVQGEWPVDPQKQREAVYALTGGTDTEKLDEAAWNITAWRNLENAVVSENDVRWLVTIIGHSSDSLPSTGEWTNYEFSMKRAFNTFGYLDDLMRTKKAKAEWRLRPLSNTDSLTTTDFLLGWDHKRSVEVLLQKVTRPNTLLNYLYFMIYTITTTGYGDFVPISSQAKFISSVANLFELLFIVVVINLVFAYVKK